MFRLIAVRQSTPNQSLFFCRTFEVPCCEMKFSYGHVRFYRVHSYVLIRNDLSMRNRIALVLIISSVENVSAVRRRNSHLCWVVSMMLRVTAFSLSLSFACIHLFVCKCLVCSKQESFPIIVCVTGGRSWAIHWLVLVLCTSTPG